MSANDGEREETLAELSFAEIVPPEWREPDNSWLWVTCYHVMRLPKDILSKRIRKTQLGTAVALIFYGTPRYYPQPSLMVQSTDTPTFLYTTPDIAVAPEGAYLFLMLRYRPLDETDYQTRVRELTLRSLLGTVLGENAVYRQLSQNAIRIDKPGMTFHGPVFRNPNSYPAPDISDERLALARDLHAAIEALEDREQNRVLLSLRWHGEARDADGIEAFVKQWVALEALGMSTENNVRPLIETLAVAYGISVAEAKEKFQVGRIFGFRSHILHRGFIPPINAALLDYLRALFKDVLWQRVGLPSECEAEGVLQREGFNLGSLLQLDR